MSATKEDVELFEALKNEINAQLIIISIEKALRSDKGSVDKLIEIHDMVSEYDGLYLRELERVIRGKND